MLGLILKTRLSLVLLFIMISVAFWYLLESYIVRNYVSLIPILFAVQILLNDFLEIYLAYEVKLKRKWFAVLIAPGTILHELSHLAAALMTGCYITGVSLFTLNPKRGVIGYVNYVQPKDKWIVFRDFIIGFSPFFGCGMILLLLAYLQSPGTILTPDLVHVDDMAGSFVAILENFFIFRLTLLSFVFIYFKLCFALGSAPSTTDIKNFFYSLLKHPISTLFIGILFYTGILLSESNLEIRGYSVSETVVFLLKATTLILLVSVSALLVSIPLAFFLDKLLEMHLAERTVAVVVPAASYITMTYLLEISTKFSITLSLAIFAFLLLVFRYPKLFLKP